MTNSRDDTPPLDERREPGHDDSSPSAPTEHVPAPTTDPNTPSVDSPGFADASTHVPSDGPATTRVSGSSQPAGFQPLPTIPGYRVESVLGRGGMGVVYEAVDEKLGRTVAIKTLFEAGFAGEAERTRFTTEARSMARLRHPNVVAVYEVGETAGRPFIVFEYAPGGSLGQRTNREPQPSEEAARTVVQLARGVQACHESGIVHRDLKPANILIGEDGALKITDFGLAKLLQGNDDGALTKTGDVMGTPSYMAPEQAVGRSDIGPACDVYALGAILYELLTGRPPFVGPDAIHVLGQITHEDPVTVRKLQPTVARDIETICVRCLEKSPERRYPSAAALADDLERHLAGEPIHARPVGRLERVWKWARRRPAAAGLIATSSAAVLAMLIGSAIYNARLDEANTELGRANADLDRTNSELSSTNADLDEANSELSHTNADLDQANAELQRELDRSREVIERGNALANWLLLDHVEAVSELRGGSSVQRTLLDELKAYLDELAVRIRDDERALGELNASDIGRAYERIAQIQGHPDHVNLGRTEEAVANYRTAEAIWARLVEEDPDDVNRRFHLAGLRKHLADVLAVRGENDEAQRLYDEQLAVCNSLVEDHSDDPRFGEFRVFLLVSLGDLDSRRGNEAKALERYEAALAGAEVAESRADATTDAEGLVAYAASRVGGSQELLGNLDEAARQYERVLEKLKTRHEREPDSVVAQQEYAKALRSLADVEFSRRRFESSLGSFERANELIGELLTEDPDNATLRRDQLVSLERIGTAAMMLERFDLAESSLERAVRLVDDLAGDDPGNVDLRRSRWIERDKLASALLSQQKLAEAEPLIREQQSLAAKLVDEHGLPTDRQGVAQASQNLGLLAVGRFTSSKGTPSELVALANVAIGHFEDGIAQFDAIAEDVELNADQQSLRGTLVMFRDTIVEARDSIAANQ